MEKNPAISTDEAMTLKKYDPITVKVGHHKRAQTAMVIASPSRVGAYVLVPYSLVHTGRQFDGSLRSGFHVATIGGGLSDQIMRRD